MGGLKLERAVCVLNCYRNCNDNSHPDGRADRDDYYTHDIGRARPQ